MIVVGLQFGHDAGVAVLRNGIPLANVIRERHNRCKHSFGINVSHIDQALTNAGLTVDDVDLIAVTSTQCYELVVVDQPDQLQLVFAANPSLKVASSLFEGVEAGQTSLKGRMQGTQIIDKLYATDQITYHSQLFPEKSHIKRDALGVYESLRDYASLEGWDKQISLKEMFRLDLSNLLTKTPQLGLFHYPMSISLKGRSIPGVSVQHHAAHAASAFYTSKSSTAAVFTHDGGFYKQGPLNGMIFYGKDNSLIPMLPHHLCIGDLYDQVGAMLGFPLFGAAGKLMGLAPYGKPVFFRRDFVGNTFDLMKNGIKDPFHQWVKHCIKTAKIMDYDISAVGNTHRILEPICVDIAASTQKLFEEIILYAIEATQSLFNNAKIQVDTLCFAGGTALNCPSNSRLFRESAFSEIHIPPNCDDSGLSMGAAQYAYYHVMDQERVPFTEDQYNKVPYLGLKYPEEDILTALEAVHNEINVQILSNPEKQAAQDLHDDKIIAWFEGKSEIGPRALGHRSLLISPKHAVNWERMNDLKIRERWRPFAPVVLADDAINFFSGMPPLSPYMLFTGQVITDVVPAITHVDRSARVQTVTEGTGGLFKVLTNLKLLSGCSVAMNTSFNGPAEPIVERPEEALKILLDTALDVLYLEGRRITRR